MATLYELLAEYNHLQEDLPNLIEMVEAGEIPAEAITDTLDGINGEIDEKIDNIACIIKLYAMEAEGIKAEEDRLKARRMVKEKAVKRLSQYLSDSMTAAGRSKFESARNVLSFRKSDAVLIADEAAFVEWAQEYSPELLSFKKPEPNRTEIKKILKRGIDVEGACLEVRYNLQVK